MRLFVALLALVVSSNAAEPLTFRRAIELATRASVTSTAAAAQVEQARFAYQANKNTYLPQVQLGSGLGYSFGFPLGEPSIFNVTAQQFLFNPSQRAFVRAAEADLSAAQSSARGKQLDVIQETAAAYLELDQISSSLRTLEEQERAASWVESVARQRVEAGVDSPMEQTRARLAAARVRMRIAESGARADVLRARLGQLTGLNASEIETVPESIPALPEAFAEEPNAADNPQIIAAQQTAEASKLRAQGERKALLPAVDIVSRYALFSKFNNYEDFYRRFERNNFGIGLNFRVPILNFAQRARAEAAEQAAVIAGKDARAAQNQYETRLLDAKSQLRQAAAAREVARLEYELARGDVEATQIRSDAGQANIRELENARLAEAQRYDASLDAEIALQKTQLQVLRLTGQLDDWAGVGTLTPTTSSK